MKRSVWIPETSDNMKLPSPTSVLEPADWVVKIERNNGDREDVTILGVRRSEADAEFKALREKMKNKYKKMELKPLNGRFTVVILDPNGELELQRHIHEGDVNSAMAKAKELRDHHLSEIRQSQIARTKQKKTKEETEKSKKHNYKYKEPKKLQRAPRKGKTSDEYF